MNVPGLHFLSAGTQPGPWHAASNSHWWYIVNAQTGDAKKIGKISMGKGINYFDRAQTEARKRNSELFEKARVEKTLPTLLGLSPEMDAAVALALRHDRSGVLDTIREGQDLAARISSAVAQDPLRDLARHLVYEMSLTAKDVEDRLQFSGGFDKEAAARTCAYMREFKHEG